MRELPKELNGLVGQWVKPVGQAGEYEYRLTAYCGSGKRGHVFRAERKYGGVRALKFIPQSKLRSGWEAEARKAAVLEQQPNTVRFFEFFFHQTDQGVYGVLVFDFVEGSNLRELIDQKQLNVAHVERVLLHLLFFRRDCLERGVKHGDLHPGNIILRRPTTGPPRGYEVMITDFGIGYTGAVLQPKEDLLQIGQIGTQMLGSIEREALDHADRSLLDELCSGPLMKGLREAFPTERGDEEAAVRRLLVDILQVRARASAPSSQPAAQSFGDYLAGEQIGDRWGEWKSLFVAGFPGYEDIISRGITVLTGTRGCGKTMVFRRLSKLLNLEIGPLDDRTANSFVGFYLNMNDIGDAFLLRKPAGASPSFARRVILFFHLSLLSEAIRVAGVARDKAHQDAQAAFDEGNRWLFDYVCEQGGMTVLYPGPEAAMGVLASELERAKDDVRGSGRLPRSFVALADNAIGASELAPLRT